MVLLEPGHNPDQQKYAEHGEHHRADRTCDALARPLHRPAAKEVADQLDGQVDQVCARSAVKNRLPRPVRLFCFRLLLFFLRLGLRLLYAVCADNRQRFLFLVHCGSS